MSGNNDSALFATLAEIKILRDHIKAPLLASVSGAAFREETYRITALFHALADAEAGTASKSFYIDDQLLCQRRENVRLKAELDKTTADVEYIAMMTDVELDTGNDEMEEGEHNEQ